MFVLFALLHLKNKSIMTYFFSAKNIHCRYCKTLILISCSHNIHSKKKKYIKKINKTIKKIYCKNLNYTTIRCLPVTVSSLIPN